MAAHIRRNDAHEPEPTSRGVRLLATVFSGGTVLARVIAVAADGNTLNVATLAACGLLLVFLHPRWREQRDDIWAKAEQAEIAARAQLASQASPPPLR